MQRVTAQKWGWFYLRLVLLEIVKLVIGLNET